MAMNGERMHVTHSQEAAAPHNVRVLLVDDQVLIAEAVRRMIADQQDIEFRAIHDPAQALSGALTWQPTVILQDLVMPGADGFDLVQRFRADPATAHVPIVVLSSKEDPQLKAHAFTVGANDYLVKLPDRLELLARLRYHSDAYLHRRERDEAFRALRESERKLVDAYAELRRLAELDSLTSLANRRRFDEALNVEWQRAQRTGRPLSLLVCDVDFFKQYNDTYGHQAGDKCLQAVAQILSANLRRPADLAARYGGEEFVMILPETALEGALSVGEACRRQLEDRAFPNTAADQGIVTLSVGAATIIPTPGAVPDTLFSTADRALYQAKRRGRNQVAS